MLKLFNESMKQKVVLFEWWTIMTVHVGDIIEIKIKYYKNFLN